MSGVCKLASIVPSAVGIKTSRWVISVLLVSTVPMLPPSTDRRFNQDAPEDSGILPMTWGAAIPRIGHRWRSDIGPTAA